MISLCAALYITKTKSSECVYNNRRTLNKSFKPNETASFSLFLYFSISISQEVAGPVLYPNVVHNANKTYSNFVKDMENVMFLQIPVVVKPYTYCFPRVKISSCLSDKTVFQRISKNCCKTFCKHFRIVKADSWYYYFRTWSHNGNSSTENYFGCQFCLSSLQNLLGIPPFHRFDASKKFFNVLPAAANVTERQHFANKFLEAPGKSKESAADRRCQLTSQIDFFNHEQVACQARGAPLNQK